MTLFFPDILYYLLCSTEYIWMKWKDRHKGSCLLVVQHHTGWSDHVYPSCLCHRQNAANNGGVCFPSNTTPTFHACYLLSQASTWNAEGCSRCFAYIFTSLCQRFSSQIGNKVCTMLVSEREKVEGGGGYRKKEGFGLCFEETIQEFTNIKSWIKCYAEQAACKCQIRLLSWEHWEPFQERSIKNSRKCIFKACFLGSWSHPPSVEANEIRFSSCMCLSLLKQSWEFSWYLILSKRNIREAFLLLSDHWKSTHSCFTLPPTQPTSFSAFPL